MDGVPGLSAIAPLAERGPTPVHDRNPRPPRDGSRRDPPAEDSDEKQDPKDAPSEAARVELTPAASDAQTSDTIAPPQHSAPNDESPSPPVGRRIDLRA
jgi:hypothetical protein